MSPLQELCLLNCKVDNSVVEVMCYAFAEP